MDKQTKKIYRMDTALFNTFLPFKRNSEQSICKDILRNLDQSSPDNSWLCFENVISGKSFTSDQMLNDIKRFAILFKHLGFQPGDCLYSLTGDSSYIFVASIAAWWLGGYVALGLPIDAKNVADQINECRPKIVLFDPLQGESVMDAMRISTFATFNSRMLSIGNLNKSCHNALNLIKNINIGCVPEIAQPMSQLLVHWSKDDVQVNTSPNKNQFSRKFRQSTRIRRDTMKEMLHKDQVLDKEVNAKSIVSTIPPSRLDGFMNGLNILMIGKGSCYQLLESGLDIETLLTFIAGSKPKVLHLKPRHYELLCTQDLPPDSSPEVDFATVEDIVIHGNSEMRPVNKEKMKSIFPNLRNYLFLEEEYFDPDCSIFNEISNESFNELNSDTSSSSGSSCSSDDENDGDIVSADSAE